MRTNQLSPRRIATLPVPLVMLLGASACGDNMSPLVSQLDASPPTGGLPDGSQDAGLTGLTYSNPIRIELPGTDKVVENCPDPSIMRGQRPGDDHWYLYCTSNPLHGEDRDEEGQEIFRLITIHRSEDLVRWTYVGDAFSAQPEWADAPQGFWAPDIQYFNDTYYLYYSASETRPGERGDAVIGAAAIGVATSDSPTGPWAHAPSPVVEPQKAPCCPDRDDWRWVIDSHVVTDERLP